MVGAVEQASSGKFVHITPDFEPASDESRRDRALFFATALSIFCAKAIRSLIAHCEKGSGKANLMSDIPDDVQSEAIKELVCITLLVALLEQKERETEWLKRYFEDCWKVADQLFSSPPTPVILEALSGLAPDDLCQIGSMNLCVKLGLGSTVEDASIYIAALLASSQSFRAELLLFGLGAPIGELDKYISAAN
jgi:hypothetical protein